MASIDPSASERSASRELMLCFAGIALGLLLSEGALRIVNPQALMTPAYEDYKGMRIFRPNSAIKHRVPPFFDAVYHTNALGFRGPIYGPEKGPNVYRIAVLGPSFSFGLGVGDDQTYARLLEQKLNAAGGKHFEVMNFGIPDMPLNAYKPFYRDVVSKYTPDLLLVHIHIHSLDPNALVPREELGGTDPTSTTRVVKLRSWMRRLRLFPGYAYLCETSNLWALIRLHIASNVDQMGINQNKQAQEGSAQESENQKLEGMWSDTLDSFVGAACGGGRRLKVVATTDRELSEPAGIVDHLRRKSATDPCFKWVELDMNPKRYTFVGEGHWNPEGHAFVADTLARQLAPTIR